MFNLINQITRRIFIGEQSDAFNAEALQHHNINCVLSLLDHDSKEKAFLKKLKIRYVTIPAIETKNMEDFREWLQLAAIKLDAILGQDFSKVLVHCEAGIDRAPFVVALWFLHFTDLELSQAYAIIKQRRKHIAEHYEWL